MSRRLAYRYATACARELASWGTPFRARWSRRAEALRLKLPAHVRAALRSHLP